MKAITEMTREELLTLEIRNIGRLLTPDEVVHIAVTLGAFWSYDYEAARSGKTGMHALLKSGRHSDGFFVSRILLEPWNIRYIIAQQVVLRLRAALLVVPDYVTGIPDGATKLGEEVTWMLGSQPACMEKVDGRIFLVTALKPNSTLLLVEDFCTRGTGFIEAVKAVRENHPSVQITPYDPVIINRGGLQEIVVDDIGRFSVLPVVEQRIQDWEPSECPLCALGSKAVKPKTTDENWHALLASQK